MTASRAVPQVLFNAHVRTPVPGASRRTEPPRFHAGLAGYRPTPLRRLEWLERRYGWERLWLKDESRRFGLPAFKILGASWAVESAIRGSSGADGLRGLVAATDGNHGRAVARVARRRGLAARIYLPQGSADERVEAIRGEGAEVVTVPGSYDDTVHAAAESCGPGELLVQDTGWPGYEEIPGRVVEGYSTLFDEVSRCLAAAGESPPTGVWVPFGVGALAAAAVDHFRDPTSESGGTKLIAVEPTDAACALASLRAGRPVTVPGPHRSIMAGLNCGTVSSVAWGRVLHGIDAAVAIDDLEAVRAMRTLSRAGLEVGESGASGAAACLAAAELVPEADRERLGLGPGARVLWILTEGVTDRRGYERVLGGSPPPTREL